MRGANLYFLNGLDMFTTYGFLPKPNCSDDILKPRKAKERYSNEWAEYNGKEYDLSETTRYEDRDITLRGFMVANSEAQFWSRYNALKNVFSNAGTSSLRCAEFGSNATINVFYKDIPKLTRLTRLKDTNMIFCEIDILLQEAQQA